MITMHLYYTGKNGSARAFSNEMEKSGIADQIRQKEGNLRYEYFLPFTDSECVLLIDSWKDQEALDDLHNSAVMIEILRLRNKYQLKVNAERYIFDENGIPEQDKEFLEK